MSQLAKILTRAATGMDAPLVTIEVHISGGLPSFTIADIEQSELVDRTHLIESISYRRRAS
jgi:hypothetical protein